MTGRSPKTIQDLIDVMVALRTPVTGCPWDLEQTFATIAPYTIEEAYEVTDAIARGDRAHLCEELGDLLLQVVYHAQLGAEEKAFDFADVVDGITTKMIRRHPHVFGDDAARSAGAAEGFWNKIKAEEKAGKPTKPASVLDDVPLPLPALTRAIKLQDKAAQVGFDWPNLSSVLLKMNEELAELEQAVQSGDQAHSQEEFGDLLFVMVNVARHMKIDPEEALRQGNRKFSRRFQRIEALLAEQGRTPEQSNLEEMDKLWDAAKKEERLQK